VTPRLGCATLAVVLRRLLLALSGAVALFAACSGDDGSVAGECVCGPGETCVDGRCVSGNPDGGGATGGTGGGAGSDGSGGTGALIADSGHEASCPEAQACSAGCCAPGEICRFDTCFESPGPCTTSDDCWSDSYCDQGDCVPYGIPADEINDEDCKRSISIDAIVPDVQCRWTAPPAGDAFPNSYHVMATPVVVDFDFDGDPDTLDPSIVFATFPTVNSYANPGVLRVISGKDCSQQFSFDASADAVMAPASVAVGDIDGDGRAEIVAAAHGGGVVAFRYDAGTGAFTQLWRSATCDAAGNRTPDSTGGSNKWSGPSIHELDDDASPEIVYGAVVYGADGCVRSSSLGFPAYSAGWVPVVADVDEDGKMELVLGNGLHEWNGTDWAAEPYFQPGSLAHGQVAVADLGNYPLASHANQDRAEVVVVSSGNVRVQTIEGTVVFGPTALPGGGSGGPPTIADFDGDGRREFASAGGGQYVVFDLDCLAGGDPAGCGGTADTDGILWTQPSQDLSSNVTGSSVFDFDADGKAEAVYADECFLRIYDGATGTVRFSAARSSGTTYENPVIVDVDGDFNTEIVSSVNDYAGTLGCPATDPLFPGATFETNHGIVVLRDELDRWASSRPVWNQHAYAVTHVGDRGETPQASQVAINWNDPALNNFRQNVQGGLEALGIPDLTVSPEVKQVQCTGTVAKLEAKICNRGTLPMASGTEVAFLEGSVSGAELCRVPLPTILGVGECDTLSCEADIGGQVIDVYVIVDPDGDQDECWEGNNVTLFGSLECGKVPT
jgi:hypothetical protein